MENANHRVVLERRTSTANGFFALLICDFEHNFGQIVSIRVKTLRNTNLVAPRRVKREKHSLPIDKRRSNVAVTMCEDHVRIV